MTSMPLLFLGLFCLINSVIGHNTPVGHGGGPIDDSWPGNVTGIAAGDRRRASILDVQAFEDDMAEHDRGSPRR